MYTLISSHNRHNPKDVRVMGLGFGVTFKVTVRAREKNTKHAETHLT